MRVCQDRHGIHPSTRGLRKGVACVSRIINRGKKCRGADKEWSILVSVLRLVFLFFGPFRYPWQSSLFFTSLFLFFEARDPSTPRPLSVMCRKTDRERIKRGRIIDNDDGVSLARTILATGEPPRERCDRPILVRIDKRLSAPVANRWYWPCWRDLRCRPWRCSSSASCSYANCRSSGRPVSAIDCAPGTNWGNGNAVLPLQLYWYWNRITRENKERRIRDYQFNGVKLVATRNSLDSHSLTLCV